MSPETTQAELDHLAQEIHERIELLVTGAQELEEEAAQAEGRKPRVCYPVIVDGCVEIWTL